MPNRNVLSSLAFLGVACALLGYSQEVVVPGISGTDCAEYHLARVEYLLGCCGSVPSGYPGPQFSGLLDDIARATLAVEEIAAAERGGCAADDAHTNEELKLNKVGAFLWRAKLLAGRDSTVGVDQFLADVDSAALTLDRFVRNHPDVSCQVWQWVAHAYVRAGRLWRAYAFARKLGEECGTRSDLDVFIGDVLYELSVYDLAARHYSAWLSTWLETPSVAVLCGRGSSLANITDLSRRGFDLPQAPRSDPAVRCQVTPWVPYVRLPSQ